MYSDFAARLASSIWPDFGETPARSTETPEITGLSTIVIDGNFPWTIVRLETDAGVTGIGESYPSPGVHEVITDYFEPVLVGENPLDVERLYHLMRESLSGRGPSRGSGRSRSAASNSRSGTPPARSSSSRSTSSSAARPARRSECTRTATPAGMVESALNDQPDETYEADAYAYARAARAAVDDGYEIIKFDLDVPSGGGHRHARAPTSTVRRSSTSAGWSRP